MEASEQVMGMRDETGTTVEGRLQREGVLRKPSVKTIGEVTRKTGVSCHELYSRG